VAIQALPRRAIAVSYRRSEKGMRGLEKASAGNAAVTLADITISMRYGLGGKGLG